MATNEVTNERSYEESRTTSVFAGEGSTGEYRPERSEIDVPRMTGAGLAGVQDAPQMSREEHHKAVRNGEIGSIHSWELVTAVDGPGTRLTVFFNGCPLRCVYCHNPDTFKMRDGKPVLAEDIEKLLLRYRPVFKASKGGVTFSGGEPAMQPAFLARLLRFAKENGIHTTIDTSGYLGVNISDQMLADIDLVLLDVKSGDEATYEKVTKAKLAPTVAFGDRLAATNKAVWIRFVLLPGWTDNPENIREVGKIIQRWSNVERVELLPFHQMARDKWSDLGYDYQLKNVEPPSKEDAEKAREILRSMGLTVY